MHFKNKPSLEDLQKRSEGTLNSNLGIEFLEVGDDFIEARMPVDKRTFQPFGLLHGGANAALAETLGSVASSLCVDLKTHVPVGLEINANHLKSAKSGWVKGRVTPLHVGRTTHVWEIKIVNENSDLICVSRLTVAIIERR
jgi:1,4-dihydroxy-2-naphthoyl-CoA hydrolase